MPKDKLRLLFITYQGGLAGSTNSIAYLAKGLAEKGHEVFVGCRQDMLIWDLLEDSKVQRIPMTFQGKFDIENWRQIRDAVKKHRIQVINAQSSYDRYTAIFAKLRYKLKVEIVHTRRQNPLSAGGWLQKWFYVKNTAGIVVISEGLKTIFAEKGYPKNHLKVIHNGIPAERLTQWNEETVEKFRQQLKLKAEEKVIGCVSRFKEQPQIIEAVAQLNDPNIKLVFAGIEQSQLEPYIDQFGLKNEVICLGDVSGKEVLNLYRLFDINILASTMDGFGLVLIEAMAMKCPVIATNFGGIADVVQNDYNGFLFENGNITELSSKIKQLLSDQPTRDKFIENGLTTAFETFSMENTILNYEEYFYGLVTKN
ncbi:glycosyltransferase family 4 protein [Roseivirga seohaensis]|uniref:glycosyltransferase family 4 protein n=1 Tax=Roseivirga seohaensis TaxID=1914963 RepID=UPI003BAC81DD